jgi:hypothetical protein
MNILMIAIEEGRWGPARLARPLREAGFRVAALCPINNPLARTRFVERRFDLVDPRSSKRLEVGLAAAMRAWRPRLIVPADEQVVAWLHTVIRRGAGELDPGMLAVIHASLGATERLDAMLMKSHTLRLARELGVRTPCGATVSGSTAALEAVTEAADRIGFPLYVKTSFSWSGLGVRLCENRADLQDAMAAVRPPGVRPIRDLLKRLAHRDWYPTDTAIDLQRAVDGEPAMFCAVAHGGKMLAGFAGFAARNLSANGPSSMVRLGHNAEMASASATMIRALGASGFIAFDFMIEARSGAAYLLECNPRPSQVGHLGSRVGVDLCGALAAALRGAPAMETTPNGETTVALFPQEWLRDPSGIADLESAPDAPWDDPELLRAMIAAGPALAA